MKGPWRAPARGEPEAPLHAPRAPRRPRRRRGRRARHFNIGPRHSASFNIADVSTSPSPTLQRGRRAGPRPGAGGRRLVGGGTIIISIVIISMIIIIIITRRGRSLGGPRRSPRSRRSPSGAPWQRACGARWRASPRRCRAAASRPWSPARAYNNTNNGNNNNNNDRNT